MRKVIGELTEKEIKEAVIQYVAEEYPGIDADDLEIVFDAEEADDLPDDMDVSVEIYGEEEEEEMN